MRTWLALAITALIMPRCQLAPSHPIFYQIREEAVPGSFIGDVIDDSRLAERYDVDTLNLLRFRFLSSPRANLTVDMRSGRLTTNGRLDRETVCPGMYSCEMHLDIGVSPVRYFQVIKVTVAILDVNDNSPKFLHSTLRLQVLESAPVFSTTFRIDEAIDPDVPPNSVQTYQLADGNQQTWRLDEIELMDGEKDIKLVLAGVLDRESISRYELKVIAYDGGSIRRSGSVDVVIDVEDVNDNIPIFDQASYEVTVEENIPPLTPIEQLRAVDADQGSNGEVVYSFSRRSLATYGSLFSINSSTGIVYVQGEVDFEETSVYKLTVIARDQGPGSVAVAVPLIINVKDLNDNPPVIKVNTLEAQDTNRSSIREDEPVDTFVAHIQVTDPDTGPSGRFSCDLQHPSFRLQSFPEEYRIFSFHELDREETDSYDLALTCTDEGIPPQRTVKNIHITVLDVNDNAPVFEKRSYKADLLENNFVGRHVVTVNATDADAGDNATVRYSLYPKHSEIFEIEPITGELKASASLDRENQSVYRLEVVATDLGQPPQNTSVLVVVRILDVNDEAPQLNSTEYSLGIDENQPPGTIVGALRAIDKDDPDYNQHEFSFMPGGSLSDAFQIGRYNGLVTTTRPLDREKQSVYHLVAMARDTNAPDLSSTAIVSIFVMDKNDNKPIFTFPTPYNHTVQLSTRVPLGSHVATVRAHDPDEGANGKVNYEITSGNGEGIFTIDPIVGTLLVNIDLHEYRTNRTFRLRIAASDRGTQPQISSTMLTVVLNNSIPYSAGSFGSGIFGDNFDIVLAVGCGSGALIIVLLVVIVVMLRRQHVKRHRVTRYNCRMQALQRLAQQDLQKTDIHVKPKDKRKVSDADYVMLPKVDPADDYDDANGQSDCSHSKSRHWLDSMDPTVHEATCRRHDDSGSIKSMEGSNTDSGRGNSDGDPDIGQRVSNSGADPPPAYQSLPSYHPPRYTRPPPQCQTFTSFRGNESTPPTPTDSLPRAMSPPTFDGHARTLPSTRTPLTPSGTRTIAIKPQGSPVFASKKLSKPNDTLSTLPRLGTFKEEYSQSQHPDRETDC